jgi:hypothetical protein
MRQKRNTPYIREEKRREEGREGQGNREENKGAVKRRVG